MTRSWRIRHLFFLFLCIPGIALAAEDEAEFPILDARRNNSLERLRWLEKSVANAIKGKDTNEFLADLQTRYAASKKPEDADAVKKAETFFNDQIKSAQEKFEEYRRNLTSDDLTSDEQWGIQKKRYIAAQLEAFEDTFREHDSKKIELEDTFAPAFKKAHEVWKKKNEAFKARCEKENNGPECERLKGELDEAYQVDQKEKKRYNGRRAELRDILARAKKMGKGLEDLKASADFKKISDIPVKKMRYIDNKFVCRHFAYAFAAQAKCQGIECYQQNLNLAELHAVNVVPLHFSNPPYDMYALVEPQSNEFQAFWPRRLGPTPPESVGGCLSSPGVYATIKGQARLSDRLSNESPSADGEFDSFERHRDISDEFEKRTGIKVHDLWPNRSWPSGHEK